MEGSRKSQHVNLDVLAPHLARQFALMIEKASILLTGRRPGSVLYTRKVQFWTLETTAC